MCSPKLGLRQRADMASSTSLSHITSAQELGYGILMVDYGDPAMRIMLEEFTWDNASLQLPYHIDGQDDLLRDWFNAYFSDADAGGEDLLGSLHFMSDPEVDGDSFITVDIDFGSAPEAAFWNLVKRLSNHGYDVIRFSRMPEVAD